jgi:hypothetical protein
MEAGPTLDPSITTKQVCPVDMGVVPTAGYADSYGGQSQYYPMAGWGSYSGQPYGTQMYGSYGYGYGETPGMIRVLSPTGETLGYAPYSVDEKGKVVVYRDEFQPSTGGVDEPWPDEPQASGQAAPARPGPAAAESFVPRAARFLRSLRQFLPGGMGFQWSR